LFVVLLALSSMLLTSALVVYVNREQNWKILADQATAKAAAAMNDRDAKVAEADAARTAAAELARSSHEQAEAIRAQLASTERQLSEKNSAIARVESDLALARADQAKLAEALKACQDTQSKQQDAIVEARKIIDDLNRKYADANVHIADLTSNLAVTERERRYFAEQVTKSQAELKQLTQALRDANIDLNKIVAGGGPGTGAGAPAINGVIKTVGDIDGIPHAVISVGSADAVIKGMEFNVIDREHGDFLGKLRIDKVESNESSGQLYGPRVGDVKAGVEVRTQL